MSGAATSQAQAAPSTDYLPETWTYAGRRSSRPGKLSDLWVDGGGRGLYFATGTRYAVGAEYEVQIHRDGELVHRRGAPRYLGPARDDHPVERWRVESRAAESARDLHLAGERAAREAADLGDLTLAALKSRMAGLSAQQRRAMIPVVLRYLGVL